MKKRNQPALAKSLRIPGLFP